MGKSIVIIGGGIAGLSAGISLLQQGYDVSIYEKNESVGGLCSGYYIDGYFIDACLHWLMGTKKGTSIHALWRNVDALNDDVEISHLPYFCTATYEGTKVTFSRDLDEEESRWLALSPIDEAAIKEFFDSVRGMARLWTLAQSETHKRLSMKALSSLPRPRRIVAAMRKSRKDYAKKFVHPALRFAIENAMTGYNNAAFFLLVYGLFSSGDGDVPFGGSFAMVSRIKERYLTLGGKLYLNSLVTSLKTTNGRIEFARLGNKQIQADYYLAALDPHILYSNLLEGKRLPRAYKNLDKNIKDHTISSCFCVYLKVKDYAGDIDIPTAIPIKKVRVGKKQAESMLVRPYSFDPLTQKEGGTVISLFVDQDQDDYAYFASKKEPRQERLRIAGELLDAFVYAYPQYEGKAEILDSFGPLELHQRTGTSYGSIQSYSFTSKGFFYSHSGKVSGIDNLYFCGQWNRAIGGTPTALISANDVVKRLVRKDHGLASKSAEFLSKIKSKWH